ncbi:MOSC domain-containing protein [Candidatus Pacearchaeota archaeon]|nr:MOSC domain-containing protein [Candidatus Pacearchaeota archaeon]
MLEGKVYQLNIKAEIQGQRGIPKFSIDMAKIMKEGVTGDYNRHRYESLGGDLDQAILIMPLEMIQELNKEGWPISAGDIGENITTQGIAYDDFKPGDSYQIGKAIVQISRACVPCKNLAVLSYVGKERKVEFVKTMLKRRGWYASVVQEGMVQRGDDILRI